MHCYLISSVETDHDPLYVPCAGSTDMQPAGKRRSNRSSGSDEAGRPPKRTRTGSLGKEAVSEVPADDADGEHSHRQAASNYALPDCARAHNLQEKNTKRNDGHEVAEASSEPGAQAALPTA